MSIVGVECNADRYFFGRLLGNKNLIRKERNDFEVINGVTTRSKGQFSIGIIDLDKNKKIPSSFGNIHENQFTKIVKHNENYQFLILLGPVQIEHWLNEYLKSKNNTVEVFGFSNFVEFMKKSKSLKPETDERFKKIIDFVIENYDKDENHISKLKRQLEYILVKKYQFNEIEFLEI